MEILVDSNVILDIATEDRQWFRWSSETLASYAEDHVLVVNPIIYSEVSVGFRRIEDLEEVLSCRHFRRDPIPWEAAFLAGKCFVRCRRRGGRKPGSLPGFLIGAHASVAGMALMTRTAAQYRIYFPDLSLIAPNRAGRP